MNISELTETQRSHLVWRLDRNTGMGLITASRVARGEFPDIITVKQAFIVAGSSSRSAAIHETKVKNYKR